MSLDAEPELAALVALVLVVRDGPVGDGDAVDATRHFAVVVEPGRGAGVRLLVYCGSKCVTLSLYKVFRHAAVVWFG